MCFEGSFEGDQGGRITDGSRYIEHGRPVDTGIVYGAL